MQLVNPEWEVVTDDYHREQSDYDRYDKQDKEAPEERLQNEVWQNFKDFMSKKEPVSVLVKSNDMIKHLVGTSQIRTD